MTVFLGTAASLALAGDKDLVDAATALQNRFWLTCYVLSSDAINCYYGATVLFGKYSGQTVKVDGEELLVMKEDDLFAVVEK